MQDFRKLEVWQVAHELTLAVYRQTQHFPTDERFGLTSQLRRALSSVEANLAEGCGRGSDVDFARFVQMAMGSASEVQCHLLLAFDLGYLPEQSYGQFDDKAQRVKRMLASFLKALKETNSQFKGGPSLSGRQPKADSRQPHPQEAR